MRRSRILITIVGLVLIFGLVKGRASKVPILCLSIMSSEL